MDRKNIGSLLSPYLSPIPAKKGFEKSLTNTDKDKIIAMLRESNPLQESHKGQKGAFMPITKNIEKQIKESLLEILFLRNIIS